MRNLIVFSSLFIAAMASAVNLNDVVRWTGSGSNRMGLVIDFNDGASVRSYLWGYRWDGVATGEDALRAMVNDDPALSATITQFSFGAALSSVTYLQQSQTEDFNIGRYWSYWQTTDGSSSWGFSPVGMSGRTLANGSVDGWSFSNPNYAATAPTAPVAAVPEPATLGALALGAVALRRRRKP